MIQLSIESFALLSYIDRSSLSCFGSVDFFAEFFASPFTWHRYWALKSRQRLLLQRPLSTVGVLRSRPHFCHRLHRFGSPAPPPLSSLLRPQLRRNVRLCMATLRDCSGDHFFWRIPLVRFYIAQRPTEITSQLDNNSMIHHNRHFLRSRTYLPVDVCRTAVFSAWIWPTRFA